MFESLTDLPCCGDPELCGSLTCQPASTPSSVKSGGPSNADTVLLPRSVEPGGTSESLPSSLVTVVSRADPVVGQSVRTVETVPCNEAWSVLKAHPNIAFASTFREPLLIIDDFADSPNLHENQTCRCSPKSSRNVLTVPVPSKLRRFPLPHPKALRHLLRQASRLDLCSPHNLPCSVKSMRE